MNLLLVAASFIAITLITDSESKRRQYYFHNFQVFENKKYTNVTVVTDGCVANTRQRPCMIFPGLKIFALRELPRPYMHVQAKDVPNDRITMEQVVSVCSLFNDLGMGIFMRLGVEILKANVEFEMACPFKKGLYEVKSFHHPYGLLLNFFEINQTQRSVFTIKNRFGKTMENVFVFQFDFEIVEID